MACTETETELLKDVRLALEEVGGEEAFLIEVT